MRPPGILGQIAAYTADHLTRRVRCKVVSGGSRNFGKIQVDDARLDDCLTVLEIDFADTLHTGYHENQPAAAGEGSTAQARARAARHKRDPVLSRYLNRTGNLIPVGNQQDEVRSVPVKSEAVTLVGNRLLRLDKDTFCPNRFLELTDHFSFQITHPTQHVGL